MLQKEEEEDRYSFFLEKLKENENDELFGQKSEEEDLLSNTIKDKKNIIKIEIDKEQHHIPNIQSKEPNTNYISQKEMLTQNKAQNANIPKKNNSLGRKKKNSNEKSNHTKYSEDNIIRKIKSSVLNIIYIFLNASIYYSYNGNLGRGILKKELKKNNQKQIVNLKNNKEFLNKNLGDIFSEDISSKFTCYQKDHNRKLIQSLLNADNYEIRVKFKILFSFTFLDCLNHLRKKIYYPELEGLGSLDNLYDKFKDDEEYLELFKYYIYNMEKIVMSKKNRNRKH